MRSKRTDIKDYEVELICKTCGRARKVSYTITNHKAGHQSIQISIPSFCIWCEREAEMKEAGDAE